MEIYRIMSFFELYELIVNKKLKMSALKLMDDKNEGFGISFLKRIPNRFNGLVYDKDNQEKLKETLTISQRTTFITSWSTEKDSMAMWLLYSKNKDSIRIKTNKEKLKKVIDSHLKEIVYNNHWKSEPKTIISPIPDCVVDEVNYISYDELNKKIEEINQLKEELLGSEQEDDYKIAIIELEIKKLFSYSKAILQKDKAFSHEKEVRATIKLSIRNDMTNEEVEEELKQDKLSSTLGTFIMKEPTEKELPNVYFIDIKENDFIEEICFDPRIPSYQKNIFMEILGLENDCRMVESNVFGSFF